MLTLTHIQSLRGAKLRSGSESPNARSLYFLEACCSTKFFEEPFFCCSLSLANKEARLSAFLVVLRAPRRLRVAALEPFQRAGRPLSQSARLFLSTHFSTFGSSNNLVVQHGSKKYKLRAFGLSLPLRSFAPLNDCICARVSILGCDCVA